MRRLNSKKFWIPFSLGLAACSPAFSQTASDQLADTAIKTSLTATGEFWQNVAGGAQAGGWWNTLLDLGVECDLVRFGGPVGSALFAQLHGVKNSEADGCFGDSTGALNPVSGTMASDHLRVFNLFYRQSWRNGAGVLKLGQLAVDDDFMGSDYAGLFVNSAFGAMPSQVGTSLSSECGYTSAFPI